MIIAIIVVAVIVWFLSAVMRSNREKERDVRVNKVAREQERLTAEFEIHAVEQRKIQQEQFRLSAEAAKQAKILAKHDEEIQKLSYRLTKAEDDIAHFSAVLANLEGQREDLQKELDKVNEKLDAFTIDLNPDNIAHSDDFLKYSDAEGITAYSEAFSRVKFSGVKASDIEKLEKRKTVLEGKIFTLDGKIYSAEQKVKKAEFDKFTAEQKLA